MKRAALLVCLFVCSPVVAQQPNGDHLDDQWLEFAGLEQHINWVSGYVRVFHMAESGNPANPVIGPWAWEDVPTSRIRTTGPAGPAYRYKLSFDPYNLNDPNPTHPHRYWLFIRIFNGDGSRVGSAGNWEITDGSGAPMPPPPAPAQVWQTTMKVADKFTPASVTGEN